MIKAIIFDYFGVVCSNVYWRLVKSDESMESGFQDLARGVDLGTLSWKEFIKEVAAKLNKSPEEIRKLYQSERIHPEVLSYAAKLHKKYKTGLISNAAKEFLQPVVEKAKLDDVFDVIVMSSVVGVAKPDPGIFQYALGKLGVKPSEAVFIDDIEGNVTGAMDVGMQAILYKDFEQMKFELEKILLKQKRL